MRVKEYITHILFHINAEASDSDPSQTAGVGRRAQYVRDALDSLKLDSRELTLDDLYTALLDASLADGEKAAYNRTLTSGRRETERRIQLLLRGWVQNESETRSG